jgi:hypothetical protein
VWCLLFRGLRTISALPGDIAWPPRPAEWSAAPRVASPPGGLKRPPPQPANHRHRHRLVICRKRAAVATNSYAMCALRTIPCTH